MIDAGVTLANRYKIITPLGAGGMGEVYRARDQRLEREVAIKVLPDELSKDHHSLTRFEREAKALAALSHPNILTIYDFGSDHDIQFAVTELLSGQTLRSKMDSSRLPSREALEIATTIANGLAAAHSAGVIHRDLKPENVFITSDGTVKILDFGLARREQISSSENLDDAATVSQTEKGTIIGTIPYMSPEQVKGDPVDVRSDIFSFGTMVYEMFTGHKPFTRKTKAETIAAIVYENPPSLPENETDINAHVSPILQRCLEKSPDKRFQSAQDLAFDLKTILNRSKPQAITFRSPFLYLTILLALLLIGAGIYFSQPHGEPIHSIAVLPFSHSGDDPDTELFSDGITDNVINTLSQLPELHVMARSTVFTFKEKDVDPRKIGKDLKVGSVLTGKVVKQNERLVVQTELVEVATGRQLWGHRFDEVTDKIFDVQEEISSEISDSLRLRISGQEKQLLKKHFTDNAKAYQLYQQGRYHWFKDTYEGYEKSQYYFNLAIQQDPNYALAYSGLSDTHIAFAVHGLMSPKEAFPKAENAAKTALKIDDQLAEGHASLGLVRYWQWDWKTGEDEFHRAIALNPNYAEAYHFLAVTLRNLGRSEEAIAAMKKALELDPLSLATNTNLGSVYFWTGHYDEAINQYRKTLEMDPNFTRAHDELAEAYARKGLYQQASLEKQKALKLAGVDDFAELFDQKKDSIGYSQALQELYESELDYRSEVAREKYVSPMAFAYIYALLGRKDEAFEWLEKAFAERSPWLAALKADPQFDSIRDDPRFRNLLQRVGLPE